eukprot:350351-Chlamydomonas_euryale.AAC.4
MASSLPTDMDPLHPLNLLSIHGLHTLLPAPSPPHTHPGPRPDAPQVHALHHLRPVHGVHTLLPPHTPHIPRP